MISNLYPHNVFSSPEYFSFFFKQIIVQLIAGAGEWDTNLCGKDTVNNKDVDGTTLFVAESFARICRRGSAGILNNYKNPNENS